MVDEILTKEMIKNGAALIGKLDERSLQPDAALWFYFPDIQQWKLLIADVKVGQTGPKELYRKIQQILAEFSDEIEDIKLDDIALVKPDAPIITLLRVAIRTGPGISGVRFQKNVINGVLIEDSYIYRLI